MAMTGRPCARCCSARCTRPLYWILAASAALRSETVALVRGPREQRVVWDIPRERVEAELAPREPS